MIFLFLFELININKDNISVRCHTIYKENVIVSRNSAYTRICRVTLVLRRSVLRLLSKLESLKQAASLLSSATHPCTVSYENRELEMIEFHKWVWKEQSPNKTMDSSTLRMVRRSKICIHRY